MSPITVMSMEMDGQGQPGGDGQGAPGQEALVDSLKVWTVILR